MSNLLERLRLRGWRMTAQRRVVAEVLDGEHIHLTADEVLTRATARLPEISRATVYNTLGELVALGEVVEVSSVGRAKRYDPNVLRAHQHLVCAGCGTVKDVHPQGNPLDVLPEGERFGFTVTGADVTYRGLCPACAAARGGDGELPDDGRPDGEPPVGEPPVGEPPVGEPPVGESPVGESPARPQ